MGIVFGVLLWLVAMAALVGGEVWLSYFMPVYNELLLIAATVIDIVIALLLWVWIGEQVTRRSGDWY